MLKTNARSRENGRVYVPTVERLESRKVMAGAIAPAVELSSPFGFTHQNLSGEGEDAGNELRVGQGWTLHVGGALPQYLALKTQQGDFLFADWHYQPIFNLPELESGQYRISVAASGEDFRNYLLSIDSDGLSLRTLQNVSIPVQGNLPQLFAAVNQLSEVITTDYIYSSDAHLKDLLSGSYELRFAEPGEDWDFRILNVFESGFEVVLPPTPTLIFSDSQPRWIQVQDAVGSLLFSSWWYGAELQLNDLRPGTYFITHAKSGEATSISQLEVFNTSHRFQDVTPARSFVKIEGPLPRRITLANRETNESNTFWHYSSVLELPQGEAAGFLIHHAASGESSSVLAVDWSGSHVKSVYDVTGSIDDFYASLDQTNVALNLGFTPKSVSILQQPTGGKFLGLSQTGQVTYQTSVADNPSDWFVYRCVFQDDTVQVRVARVYLSVRRAPVLSYFDPLLGTVDIETGLPPERELIGGILPRDFVVINQYGSSIDYIRANGTTAWKFETPVGMASVAIDNGNVVYPHGSQIGFLSLQDGVLKTLWTVTFDTAWIRFVNPIGNGRYLIARETLDGQEVLEIRDRNGFVYWTSPEAVSNPRWAIVLQDLVIVADTFNFRVWGMRLNSDELEFSIPALYPNDVRAISPSTLLVTEEHGDRVWKLHLPSLQRELVLAAPNITNLELTLEQLMALVFSADARINPTALKSKSKSSMEFSGTNTLYSPNAAIPAGNGTYYIADTDNHRVVHVSAAGTILAEFRGLNNPVKLALVES